ncbi:MAG: hypothetical protein ABW321_21015 [Polyangiales bacterium]
MQSSNKCVGSIALASLLCQLGCDAQVDADYEGDALWTLRGSVISADVDLSASPEPAIMWTSGSNNARVFSPMDVRGEFPSRFSITAFESPPEVAQTSMTPLGIPASLAVGHVVAVDASNAPFYPNVLPYGSDTPPVLGPGETLVNDADESWLLGAAPEHLLVFLDGVVPAEYTCLANLEPGYNLLALTERSEAEWDERKACRERADNEGLSEYNAAHGTAFTLDTLPEERSQVLEIERTIGQVACKIGCELFKNKSRVLGADQAVTLHMQRDVELVDWN